MLDINLVGVLLATVASIVLGFAWYSKSLFGGPWMKILGIDKLSKKEMMKGFELTMTVMVAQCFFFCLVMAVLLKALGVMDVFSAIFWSVVLWATFVGGVIVSNGLFARTRKKVLLIDAGYRLVMMVVVAVIVTVIR